MAEGVRTRLSRKKKLRGQKRSNDYLTKKTVDQAAELSQAVLVSVGRPFFRLLTGFLITSLYIFLILRKLFSLWTTTLSKQPQPYKIFKKRHYSKITKSITFVSYSFGNEFRRYLEILKLRGLRALGFFVRLASGERKSLPAVQDFGRRGAEANFLRFIRGLTTLGVREGGLKSHNFSFKGTPTNIRFQRLKSVLSSKLLYIRSFAQRKKNFFYRPVLRTTGAWLRFKYSKTILISAFFAFFGSGLVLGFWYTILKDLPQPEDSNLRSQPVSTKIYDRNRKLLYKIFKNENRTVIPLSQIPLHLRQATIAIEDAEFYSHLGFSVKGIVRSILKNLTKGELAGGSTITQQLVKNTLLTPKKTIARKLKELALAIRVESKYTKDQILEMYLNQVAYGGAAYGVEEASQFYFGKTAKALSLAEASLLAGLAKSPSRFSPFGPNPEISKQRQKEVLSRMYHEGFVTKEQLDQAQKEEVLLVPRRTEIKAPHFVMYVKEILTAQFGEKMVEEGGLEVITSLDLEIQEKSESIVKQEVSKLKKIRVGNGAAIVTNPKTGEVLAMVGSKDYFDSKEGNFNVTDAPRQPGSAIKVVNYSYALENGMTPATILVDEPITYNVSGQPPYTPKNYDGQFMGKIPLRTALASSRNVPAVRTLASFGVDKMIEQGKRMGITTWNDKFRFGLSLTLGGGEVKMTDLAVVYGVIANYGKRVSLNPILEVKDWRGRRLPTENCGKIVGILEVQAASFGCLPERVLSEEVAFQIIDILKDNDARSPAFGSHSLLVIPSHGEIAAKTGTTNNLRDNWTIGFNQFYLVATWVGNNNNTPMAWVASGVTGATSIWHKIMRVLVDETTNHLWEIPEGLIRVSVCPYTGTLPCDGCPGKEEWFKKGTEPKNYCSFVPSPTPIP